jgi:serine/threonine-protein kinase
MSLYVWHTTLGSLGRLHLRSVRTRDARDCFELDLEIATELGDRAAVAQIENDLGRTFLAEDPRRAEAHFRRSIALWQALGRATNQCLVRKDLALALLRQDRMGESEVEIDAALALLEPGNVGYIRLLLDAVRAEWLVARRDSRAETALADVARRFREADLPDSEIEVLLALAKVLAARKAVAAAEDCVNRALVRARSEGYARHLPRVREAMAGLSLLEPIDDDEGGRLDVREGAESVPSGYTIVRRLGRGRFGEVYKAFDPRSDRIVAIKRILLDEHYDPRIRRRLLTSARMEVASASRVRHPGIVRVFAIGTDAEDCTYVVEDFIDGPSLRDIMRRTNRADPVEVVRNIVLMANALAELHAPGIGVVHRDLKPENIVMRRPNGPPVLVDFGVASVHRFPESDADGTVLGTIAHMAPEQARGSRVDGRADVFALGVIFYEWLTGVRPRHFRSATASGMLNEVEVAPMDPIASYRPGLSPALKSLIGRMLDLKRSGRPTAVDVADECAHLLQAPMRLSADQELESAGDVG